MTSNGLLQHEGSGPPSDLSKSYSGISSPQRLVLDIAAVCPQPGEFTPLMLRKQDARRHLTQTWKFTPDGRLCCGYANLCVQSEGNHLGLRSGMKFLAILFIFVTEKILKFRAILFNYISNPFNYQQWPWRKAMYSRLYLR